MLQREIVIHSRKNLKEKHALTEDLGWGFAFGSDYEECFEGECIMPPNGPLCAVASLFRSQHNLSSLPHGTHRQLQVFYLNSHYQSTSLLRYFHRVGDPFLLSSTIASMRAAVDF